VADDLFSPTISAPVPAARPWRVGSLVYPAFFGGPLAAAALGAVNGRRLGLGVLPLLGIGAAGLVGIVARMFAIAATISGSLPVNGVIRGALGLAVFAIAMLAQRRRYRAFELRGGEPASLVGPGIIAVVAAIALDLLLLVMVSA
jgi:hypothetical protein